MLPGGNPGFSDDFSFTTVDPKDGLRETAIHTDKSGNRRKSRRKENTLF